MKIINVFFVQSAPGKGIAEKNCVDLITSIVADSTEMRQHDA